MPPAAISMSSTKSSIGHLLGAAGAVEAIFSILAIRDQVAPPTLNLDNPSVETPIDLVPHQARKREIDVVLSNSFGFGGTNASLVFRRVRHSARMAASLLTVSPYFAFAIRLSSGVARHGDGEKSWAARRKSASMRDGAALDMRCDLAPGDIARMTAGARR